MKRLLLVVDYQKDFVDGALGFPGAEALDGPIAAKIAACRAAGDDVAFTLDTHGPDYLDTQEGRKLPVPHCLLNSEAGSSTARRDRPWSAAGIWSSARAPSPPCGWPTG